MSVLSRLPALTCLSAWTLGIVAATALAPARPVVGILAVSGAALAACLAVVVRPALVGLVLAAALAGMARGEAVQGDPGTAGRAAALAGTAASVSGLVAGEPSPTAAGYQFVIAPEVIATAGGPRRPAGNLLAEVRGAEAPADGERVRVTGKLALPSDQPSFDRRAYLAQHGVYLVMRGAQLKVLEPAAGAGLSGLPARLRALYQTAIERLLPQPDAALLVAVVLGVRSGIPARLRQDLIATGLVHLLVLSGLKVAVFARLATAAMRPILRRQATLPALALIALYCLAGGATPAAVRASAMGALTLLASHLGRPTHVWTSLAATAAVMLGWAPELVWDLGFQLSFAGTAAIILLTPPIEHRLGWMPALLRESFAVTCAAQVGTLPLQATGFHLVSPIAPLANALVLPLLPAMVAAGILLVPLAAVPAVGRPLALPLAALLQYLDQLAALLARLPAAALPLPRFGVAAGVAYYVALVGAVVAAHSAARARRLALVATLVATLMISGFELAGWARPAASVTVLDVGAGQAVLLRGPGGDVLVDGGPSPARLASALGTHLPPWQRELAGLVITGPGMGHVGGLAGLGYRVRDLLVADRQPPGSAWRSAALSAITRGARLWSLHAGMRLSLAGLRLDVLAPEPGAPEPGQVAIEVAGPSHTFCDLADLDPDQQLEVAARLRGGCDALLVPKGGAPVPELLHAARPSRFVLSDTANDRVPRGLPAGELSRTSQEGDVELPL